MKLFKRKKEADQETASPEIVQPLPLADTVDVPTPGADAGNKAAQETEPAAGIAVPDEPGIEGETNKPGFFSRLRQGLGRTSENLVQGMGTLFLGRKEIDEELLEELESRLLLADVGVDATRDIIDHLTERVSRKELTHAEGLQAALREELLDLLKPCEQNLEVASGKPFVILMVGVNGVGKTTTIGKLASRFDHLDRELADRPYLAGDAFTVPDAYAFTVLGWTRMFDIDLDRWRNVKAFVRRVRERPAVAKALEVEKAAA